MERVAIHHGRLPFIVLSSKKKYLSKFVLPSWLKSSRDTIDRFIFTDTAHNGNTEVLVWRTNKTSQVLIDGRTDIVPVEKVIASEKNYTAFT